MNLEKSSMTTEEIDSKISKDFFFDTYAFYEIIKENKNYEKYLSVGIVTAKLNLFELYFGFLKDGNLDLAMSSLEKYYRFGQDFDQDVIREAAKLKKSLNKRKISMTDCIGYALAKQLEIGFLTGDEDFKDLDNVEFVK